jgi:hypothetical protein
MERKFRCNILSLYKTRFTGKPTSLQLRWEVTGYPDENKTILSSTRWND